MSFHAFGVSEGGRYMYFPREHVTLVKNHDPPKKMMSQAAQVDVNM